MIEKITPAKKAMSVFVFHESEEKKNRSHPVDEKNDVSAKPNNSSYKSCILEFNISWHRPRKYLQSFILHYINFCSDSFIFEHYFCPTLFFPLYWAAVVLFWCFTWRCFLSLRLQCDCVVYRAGFLLSHVKRKIRGTAIAATGSSKIVAISVSFANQLTMLMAQLMRNETAYAWVVLTLNRTIPRGVLPYISHIGTGEPRFNMDISLARTVGFVLGERKPLHFLWSPQYPCYWSMVFAPLPWIPRSTPRTPF